MRWSTATAISALVIACNTIPVRQPLAQQPIGTGVPGGPTATPPSSAPASGSEPSSSPSSTSSEPSTTTPSSSASAGPPATVADLCPPKGQKPDLSRLATKGGCKAGGKPRPRQLTELRSNEQLLASMQPSAPEREELVAKLAVGYAQLECSIASACAKSRDTNAAADDITLVEAKKKTDEYCGTLKSDFPKSKRHCP